MKVEVIKRFVDRDSKSLCEVGKILDYSESRVQELIDGGYVKTAFTPRKQEKTRKEGVR